MSRGSAVSVILPVYNGERFLVQAIESILHQSHADFELLVLDDGSSDRSTDIARTYAETDRRIHVHVQPLNRGITATLNAGVHLARGELIAIANQDDVCLPERLAKQVAFLRERQEVVIVGAAAQIIDEQSVVRTLKSYPVEPEMAAWRMYFGSTLLHPVSTLRRRALLEIGGYPTGYRGGSEDYAMNVRLARIGRVANLPDVLLQYRAHSGNVTRLRSEEQQAEADRIVAEQCEWLTGVSVPTELARGLRGLSIDQFPQNPADIGRLATLVQTLYKSFVNTMKLSSSERRLVAADAGMRLLQLAALAGFRTPSLSAHLVVAAIRTSPASVSTFSQKVGRHLYGRIRGVRI